MARTAWPTFISGDSFSAAQSNTYNRDNDLAYWVFTTAGDLAYATSSSALARLALTSGGLLYGGASAPAYLAVGALHTVLKSDGTNPVYGSLIYRRQGGSATIWDTVGATNYSPAKCIVQTGKASLSVVSGVGSVAVTFPVAFAYAPIVFVGQSFIDGEIVTDFGVNSTTATQVSIAIKLSGTPSATLSVRWLAIGE